VTQFSDLGLAAPVLKALQKQDYLTPTPIQLQAIPVLLQGHDLLGIAQTGTGKTAAFATPLLTLMADKPAVPAPRSVRVLVLAPTRELVLQIAESFRAYARYLPVRIATVIGGACFGGQTQALLRGLDVLVATPGRLLDHLEQGNVKLDRVEAVVLDEADHMLDLGFLVPIRKIMAKLPHERQSLFFSATMPKEIARLSGEFLSHPKRVEVAPVATTAERVEQEALFVQPAAKGAVLAALLAQDEFERSIVFTRTKRGAEKVCKLLEKAGIRALSIHGNKSQAQRQAALGAFRSGEVRALIATDIAARGIDVPGISHVINFELPDVAESYVHRIGRTARAGKAGVAISLVAPDERPLLLQIERLTRQTVARSTRDVSAAVSAQSDSRELADMLAQDEAMRAGRVVRSGKPRQGQPPQRNRRTGQGKPAQGKPAQGKLGQGKPAHAGAAHGKPQTTTAQAMPAHQRPARTQAPAPQVRDHQPAAVEGLGKKRRTRPGSRARARARAAAAAE